MIPLLLVGGFIALTTQASAVVYCAAGVYRAGCVARPVVVAPAVVVAPRPVVVAPRAVVVAPRRRVYWSSGIGLERHFNAAPWLRRGAFGKTHMLAMACALAPGRLNGAAKRCRLLPSWCCGRLIHRHGSATNVGTADVIAEPSMSESVHQTDIPM